MNPYRTVSEDDVSITYEYNSTFTWSLYVILSVILGGMAIENKLLQLIGGAFILMYFLLKLVRGKTISLKIKSALKSGVVELSGNKHSFSNPLRIKVPKNV